MVGDVPSVPALTLSSAPGNPEVLQSGHSDPLVAQWSTRMAKGGDARFTLDRSGKWGARRHGL